MSSKNRKLLRERENTIIRKRLYKAGSHWDVATTGLVALGAATGGLLALNGHANADVAMQAPAQQVQTQTQAPATTATQTVAPSQTGTSAIQGPTTNVNTTSVAPTVNSANTAVANGFSTYHHDVEDAGGTINQTPTSVYNVTDQNADQVRQEISSQANFQVANMSATQSVDAGLASNVAPAQSAAHVLGTSLNTQSAIDVSSMTPNQIASLGSQMVTGVSLAGSADTILASEVTANSGAIHSAGGVLAPASAIDVSSMTPSQIASLTAKGAAMISATGSADIAVNSAANMYSSDINAVGGQLTKLSAINTAEGYTPAKLSADVESQINNMSNTAYADREIKSAVGSALRPVSNNSGVMSAGSTINTSSMTPDEIRSIVAHQSAMVSATAQADVDVENARRQASAAINQNGGKLVEGSQVNTADNMTVSQVLSMAQSEADNISAAGSAATVLNSLISTANSVISAAGGQLVKGSSVDVSKMTGSQIKSMANSNGGVLRQVENLDSMIVKTTSQVSGEISAASGVMKPGKTIDATNWTPSAIASEEAQQSAMLSVTGRADAGILSDVNSARPIITKNGGTLSQTGTINTADNMTVSEVLSTLASQGVNISNTASADAIINSAIAANSGAITSASAVYKPGKAINVSSMSPSEIASIASHQAEMVNATGSADRAIVSDASAVRSDITKNGGTLTESGTINTADNMTPSEIASSVQSQALNLSNTASADRVINSAIAANSATITSASGIYHPGSAINVSSMTPSEIASIASHQAAMVNATGSADSAVTSDVNSAKGDITKNGGTISLSGSYNTADNMTVSEIASTVISQSANISNTASADRIINSAIAANSATITSASGIYKPGSAINVSSMTPSEIASIASHQAAMVNATGSADAAVTSDVASARGDITRNGGTIKLNGSYNTADNMTVSEIASTVVSQSANISNTASADRVINSALVANSGKITRFKGKYTPGSTIDVSSMTVSQISSIASHQAAMISATGSADVAVSHAVKKGKSAITKNGGTITRKGTINTANNMTVKKIASTVKKQVANISNTAKADTIINSAIAANSGYIASASAIYKPGSAINVSSMSSKEIASIASHQAAMVNATGSADKAIVSDVVSATSDITKNGGTIKLNGSYNTADNMNPSEIASTVVSQSTNISNTASADRVVNSAIVANSGKITGFKGSYTPGSSIDVSSMTTSEIQSIASHQAAMVNATGSADVAVSDAIVSVTSDITKNGGTISQKGTINTANNMTVSDVASTVTSQVTNLKDTQSADIAINSAIVANSGAITSASGVYKPGSAIDVSSMSPSEIASITSEQVAMVNATGSADSRIMSDVNSATPDITKNGGTITLSGNINTADNMNPSEIASTVVGQESNISATASADRIVNSAVSANAGKITGFKGSYTPGSAINVTSMTISQISSIASHQAAMVNATGSADVAVSDEVTKVTPDIKLNGGTVTQSGTINTANNMTVSQIALTVISQKANLDATQSADVIINSAIVANSGYITTNSGVYKPGSAINVTSMTTSEIQSIASHQAQMVSATGSADKEIHSDVVASTSAINNAGGTITHSGDVNTADNMNPTEIASLVNSEEVHVTAAGSGDLAIKAAQDKAQSMSAPFGGSVTTGSASDVTHTDPKVIASFVASQDAKISQVGSDNVALSQAEVTAKSLASAIGGKFTKGSVIDVTSMDPKSLASLETSQVAVLSAVGVGDSQMESAIVGQTGNITTIGGSIIKGADINGANYTADQVLSLAQSQTNNIKQTGQGDVVISDAVKKVNSETVTRGSAVNVSSMTSQQIANLAQSQADKMGETQTVNDELHKAVSDDMNHITRVGGKLTTSGVFDTTHLNSAEIASAGASQAGLANETATADDLLSDAIRNNTPAIEEHGGWIHSDSAIDTTTMTSEQIVDATRSQTEHLTATGSADSVIDSAVNNNQSAVEFAGAWIKNSGVRDVTNVDSATMNTYAQSTSAHIWHTGNGDRKITSTVNANKPDIVKYGGFVTSSATTDVTTWTDSKIDSLAASESSRIQHAGDGTRLVEASASANIGAVQTAGGWLKNSGTIDVTSMTDSEITSFAVSQANHLQHTGDADRHITTAVNNNKNIIQALGGALTSDTSKDVTRLTDNQIDSYGSSTASRIQHTGDGDRTLSSAVRATSGSLALTGATAHRSAAIDVTNMTDAQIDALAASQAGVMSGAASADAVFSNEMVEARSHAVNVATPTQVSANNSTDINNASSVNRSNLISAENVASASQSVKAWIVSASARESLIASEFMSAAHGVGRPGVVSTVPYPPFSGQDGATIKSQIDGAVASANSNLNDSLSDMERVTSADNAAQGLNGSIANLANEARNIGLNVTTSVNGNLSNADQIRSAYASESAAIVSAIGSQSAANSSYLSASNSIENSYNTAMTSYTNESTAVSNFNSQQSASYSDAVVSTNNSFNAATSSYNSQSIAVSNYNSQQASSYSNAQKSYQDASNAAQTAQSNAANISNVGPGAIALTSAIQAAQSVPGLTLINDGTSVASQLDGTDTNAVNAWKSSANADDQNQANAIQSAINAQRQKNQNYQQQINQLSSEPVDAQNGNLKLVGNHGPTGSIAYYQAMSLIGIPESATVLENIGWHSNSSLSGANGPAKIYPAQMSLYSGDNLSNFYDVTEDAKNNKSLTLTNAAQDQYGNWYDLHFTLSNPDVEASGNPQDPTNLIVGPSGDQSIEFDGYGGFHKSNINVYNIYFTPHNGGSAVNATIVSTFADLDAAQFLKTNLNNALSYIPSGANVHINGNGDYEGPVHDTKMYDSTPDGTFFMVGQGTSFNVAFGWSSDASMYQYIRNNKDPYKVYTPTGKETGFQFNLFGPSAHSKIVLPEYTTVHYHNNSTSVKTTGTPTPPPGPNPHQKPQPPIKTQPPAPQHHNPPTHPTKQKVTLSHGSVTIVRYHCSGDDKMSLPTFSSTIKTPVFTAESVNPNYRGLGTHYQAASSNYTGSESTRYTTESTHYTPVATRYNPYSVTVADHFNYTYSPLSTTYHVLDDQTVGTKGYNPETMKTTPLSVTYQSYSTDGSKIPSVIPDGHGGYKINPKFTGYTPISTTYKNYSTDGQAIKDKVPSVIKDKNGNWVLNPKFTGYTPISTTYKNYSTDGSKIPPVIPDGHGGYKINPKFTGYTPISTTYKNYSTDGQAIKDTVPSIIKDKNGNWVLNPKFTGYTPISTTYKNYSTDGSKIPPVIPNGHGGYKINPKFTGYTPISTTYKNYSTDGQAIKDKVPSVIKDKNGNWVLNPKFTGYTPISTTYKNYSTDGSKIPPVIPDGHGGYKINPKFTGYTPISTTYKNYSTDGTKIPPVIPDGHGGYKINPKFTGYTPISTTYKNYSTDGQAIKDTVPSVIKDKNGNWVLNPKFTGYTPISTTYKNYSTDGSKIPPVIPDGHGGYKINPKFTGYTPISTTYKNYSTDGQAIKDTVPSAIKDENGNWVLNPKFTGYTPISTTYKNYSTDGSKIPPVIPNGHGGYKINPKFTGYTPISTTYKNYSTDGQAIKDKVPSVIKDKNGNWVLNPKFTGYTPISTTYKNYSTDGSKIPPVIPDGHGGYKINPKFTGYTPISTTYKNYSTDGTKIPPVIPDGHGGWILNPKFTGYTPISTVYQGYSTDGSKIPPMIPDGHGGWKINPKFTGYTPISTTYKNYSTDGSKIPPVIPDGHGGWIKNPKFTGYAPMSYTYHPIETTWTPFSSNGSKIPPMIPDGHGGWIPNPKFTGYTPFSTSYAPYSNDGRGLNPKNPNFSGYVPLTAKYAPLSTTYHFYKDQAVPQPTQPTQPIDTGIPVLPKQPTTPAKPTPVPTSTPTPAPSEAPQPTTPEAPQPTPAPAVPGQPEQPEQPVQPAPQAVPQAVAQNVPASPLVQPESVPQAPESVESPAQPETQPAPEVVEAPAPQVEQEQAPEATPQALPQTGESTNNMLVALLGTTALAITMGLGLIGLKKRKES